MLQDKIAAVRLQASHLAASITEHSMKNRRMLRWFFIDNVSSIFNLILTTQNLKPKLAEILI